MKFGKRVTCESGGEALKTVRGCLPQQLAASRYWEVATARSSRERDARG